MKVTSGAAPWHEGYKRVTKKTSEGREATLTSGWRFKPEDSWLKSPVKIDYKEVNLYNGRRVKVPVGDYKAFYTYQAMKSLDPDSEIAAYIEQNFIKNKDKLHSIQGVGHIELIEYNAYGQVMQVTFKTDGSVVVFFRVPKELYSELEHLAKSESTFVDKYGNERHVLGKVFWDMIRIRGQRYGSKYKYTYTNIGALKGNKSEQQIAGFAKEARLSGTEKEDEAMYDKLAKNMLTGSKLDEYNKQESYEAKLKYLRKAGIL